MTDFHYERHARETQRPGDWFDTWKADHVCAFFERYLRHSKGRWAGQAFRLAAWQRAYLRTLFGWKRADGTRRFRKTLLKIARKNGKSTLAAGIALYLTMADREPRAEVYSVAADKEQAKICHDEAKAMRLRSPALLSRTEVFANALVFGDSSYKPLSSKGATRHGKNTSGAIYDEFHEFPDRDAYEAIDTSTGARAQPLQVIITTEGVEDADSVFTEVDEIAHRILAGDYDCAVDDAAYEFLPALFEADAEDDWEAPATWAKANPGLGDTVSIDYIRAKVADAKRSPAALNTFKRLHLNIRVAAVTQWLDAEDWKACAGPVPWQQLEAALAGRACYGGLDLSTKIDLTAFTLVFPPIPGAGRDTLEGKWVLLPRFWLPELNLRRREDKDRKPYRRWVEQGLLFATPGNQVDYDRVREQVLADSKRFRLLEVPFDRWNAAHITTQLRGDGIQVVDYGQGFRSFAGPCRDFEGMVRAGEVAHGGNPMLLWQGSVVTVKTDETGFMKPVKPDRLKSGNRIDGVVAGLMGIGRAIVAPKPVDMTLMTTVLAA